jgi:signal transduction histidine kinase
VTPRKADLLIGAGGAVVGTGVALLWGGGSSALVVALLLGAALGGSRSHPRSTWLFAGALVLAAAALGRLSGDDAFSLYPLVAAHAFCAGRFDPHWNGLGGLAWLSATTVAAAPLAHTNMPPFVFITVTAWGAGRALRERDQVARQLERRAQELEEEREAYARLSVRYERTRIASELHDIVAHAISVMVVQASAGQRLAARDPDATAEAFGSIADAARQAEQDLGRLVALLGDENLVGAAPDIALVEELVTRASRSGLDVTLRLEGEREGLPAEVAEAAYHVVQEGLTNALRYAAGAPVRVLVRGGAGRLLVEVTNDPAAAERALAGAGAGTGLRGLRERVAACGGELEAGPTATGGWEVRARLAPSFPRMTSQSEVRS